MKTFKIINPTTGTVHTKQFEDLGHALEYGANSYDGVIPEVIDVSEEQKQDLIGAAQFAARILAKIPAFGDSIGHEISKAQIGVALNRLTIALASISTTEGKL